MSILAAIALGFVAAGVFGFTATYFRVEILGIMPPMFVGAIALATVYPVHVFAPQWQPVPAALAVAGLGSYWHAWAAGLGARSRNSVPPWRTEVWRGLDVTYKCLYAIEFLKRLFLGGAR